MIKLEFRDGRGVAEVTGSRDEVIIETGFAMYNCVKVLRDCGKSDMFIKEMFMIALTHEDESDD